MDTRIDSRTLGDAQDGLAPVTRTASAAELPDLVADGERLWQGGVRRIRIEGSVVASVPFLRCLRDALEHGITVTWDGDLDPGVRGAAGGSASLFHLPPPTSCRDHEWVARYRYGLCHFRVGPRFWTLVDRRAGPTAVPVVLRDQEELTILRETAEPVPVPASEARRRLAERGLILEHDGVVLRLPYRLRRWPIPCTAL